MPCPDGQGKSSYRRSIQCSAPCRESHCTENRAPHLDSLTSTHRAKGLGNTSLTSHAGYFLRPSSQTIAASPAAKIQPATKTSNHTHQGISIGSLSITSIAKNM